MYVFMEKYGKLSLNYHQVPSSVSMGKNARISDLVGCESVEGCIHPDCHKGIFLQSFHQRWCSGTDEGIL